MSEKREYFRIRIPARLSYRFVPEEDVEEARLRVRARSVVSPIPPGALEATRLPGEMRVALEILGRIAVTLERIDQRVDALIQIQRGGAPSAHILPNPIEISLSASGLACPTDLGAAPGDLLEITLELCESGIPPVPALARVVKRVGNGEGRVTALRFVELQSQDRERLVQLALRRQSRSLREEGTGGQQ